MELMLSESWKEAYAEYLAEEDENLDNDIDNTLLELYEAQAEAKESFSLLKEYYTLFAINEGVITESTEKPLDPGEGMDENGNRFSRPTKKNDGGDVKKSKELIKTLISSVEGTSITSEPGDVSEYKAASTYELEDIRDMKFPKNIIFFIGRLIKWIRNLVLYFIEKFKNLIRRLVGAQPKELNPEAIKLNLIRARKVESISTLTSGITSNAVVQPRIVKASELEKILTEGLSDKLGITLPPKSEANPAKQPIIITIDLSRDIQNLKSFVDHFYKLFDHAYGSNNEHLFSTGDLEIILNTFKTTIERMRSGNIAQYSVSGGVAIDAEGVNPERVKQNLINTTVNMNNLKKAFTDTSAKIQDLSKIINSKQMLMLSDIGASYTTLTSDTYVQLISILETMPERLKKATAMEKEMSKMKNEYTKLVNELQSMQKSFAGVSNVTYDTIYNRKVIELLNSANWMTDTVSLRLTGIGLYIREMKDVRDSLVMLAGTQSMPRKGKFRDFLQNVNQIKLNNKLYKKKYR